MDKNAMVSEEELVDTALEKKSEDEDVTSHNYETNYIYEMLKDIVTGKVK